jgi:hypothetical protein
MKSQCTIRKLLMVVLAFAIAGSGSGTISRQRQNAAIGGGQKMIKDDAAEEA